MYALSKECCVLQRQQEMLQHQQTQGHWLSQLKPAPTFYPTEAEFEDPISYIRSIQTEGSKHGETRTWLHLVLRSTTVGVSQQPACLAGICKIVPPVIPTVPSGLVSSVKPFTTLRIRLTCGSDRCYRLYIVCRCSKSLMGTN